MSLAHRDIINILTVLCGLAQHTDKAYVGLLQGIPSKLLFMQICKLQIDKIVYLKDSLFMSRSRMRCWLTGCVVGVPLGWPQAPSWGQHLFLHETPGTDEWWVIWREPRGVPFTATRSCQLATKTVGCASLPAPPKIDEFPGPASSGVFRFGVIVRTRCHTPLYATCYRYHITTQLRIHFT